MQYRLRSLIIATTVCPPLLAGLYWVGVWLSTNPIALGIAALLGLAAAWIISPIIWYRELMRFVCGPECFHPLPRKKHGRTRYRLERYAGEST
jgi:hypothetical protein